MKKMLRLLLVIPAFFLVSQVGFSSGCQWLTLWCDLSTYEAWCVNTGGNSTSCSVCGYHYPCMPAPEA